MTAESRTARGRRRGPRSAIVPLAGLAFALALAGGALLQYRSTGGAFATAPPGTYAVVIRGGETQDTVLAVPLDGSGDGFTVGSIDHLPGHTVTGSVSPDGNTLALVVADSGPVSQPRASLVFLDMLDGTMMRALDGIDPRQAPPWTPNGEAVAVARTLPPGEQAGVEVIRVQVGGPVSPPTLFADALYVSPFAFGPGGEEWLAVLDDRGSTLYREGEAVAGLGPYITRDWTLSPDGSAVAYIEVNTDAGLRYVARLVEPGAAVVRSELAVAGGQSLGVAWSAGVDRPTFGLDPATALTADGAGFDIPIAFAADGSALAVEHWTGTSYDEPGQVRFEAITPAGRLAIEPATRFLGWVIR